MLFSSLEFIFLFLPITLLVYYISPSRVKNAVLFLSGIVFYAFGEIRLLPIFLLTIALDFCFGLLIEKFRQKKKLARFFLILSVAVNLALLGYFKYFDFLRVSVFALEPMGILLPVGISFYTFQALSYVIDVYKGEVRATKNIINFGAYISLFPQLIAGPIVKYSDIERQLAERSVRGTLIANGLRRFICGLAKKVILANASGELFEIFCDSESYLSAILVVFFFGMQIYFDFSGYSDMAIGLGRMLGFEFVENFNYPYISRSVSEFWRRWHISLSTFFKEYVYIPLGGSRKGRIRLVFNLLTVWALTGIWHGAAWNFLLRWNSQVSMGSNSLSSPRCSHYKRASHNRYLHRRRRFRSDILYYRPSPPSWQRTKQAFSFRGYQGRTAQRSSWKYAKYRRGR